MLAPYGGTRWSEGGAQAPGAPPLDTPLILSRILAQSRVTFCLNYVGRVTHDCASILDSIAKGIPCYNKLSHGASLHPY